VRLFLKYKLFIFLKHTFNTYQKLIGDYLLTKCISVVSDADLKELINYLENVFKRPEQINNLKQKLYAII